MKKLYLERKEGLSSERDTKSILLNIINSNAKNWHPARNIQSHPNRSQKRAQVTYTYSKNSQSRSLYYRRAIVRLKSRAVFQASVFNFSAHPENGVVYSRVSIACKIYARRDRKLINSRSKFAAALELAALETTNSLFPVDRIHFLELPGTCVYSECLSLCVCPCVCVCACEWGKSTQDRRPRKTIAHATGETAQRKTTITILHKYQRWVRRQPYRVYFAGEKVLD